MFAAPQEMLDLEAGLPDKFKCVAQMYRPTVGSTFDSAPLAVYAQYVFEHLATVCMPCRDKLYAGAGAHAKLSLRGGINFGALHKLNLLPLTLAEQMVLSPFRVMSSALKIVDNRGTGTATGMASLKGHMACMIHDSVIELSTALPRLDAARNLAVWFVGSKDRLAALKADGTIRAFLKTVLHVCSISFRTFLSCIRSLFFIRSSISPMHIIRRTFTASDGITYSTVRRLLAGSCGRRVGLARSTVRNAQRVQRRAN